VWDVSVCGAEQWVQVPVDLQELGELLPRRHPTERPGVFGMEEKVVNCENCGACCMEQNTPPGYLVVIFNPANWPVEFGDHDRVTQLPEEARAAIVNQGNGSCPCCWLDLERMRCRWYEHRPQVCRNFVPGSEACLSWRDNYDIDIDAGSDYKLCWRGETDES
jgi:Fe-S-cluster containining protein